jgi:hypothetical protein
VLRTFVSLKISCPRPVLNPRTLGPVASRLTITPPRTTFREVSVPAYGHCCVVERLCVAVALVVLSSPAAAEFRVGSHPAGSGNAAA